LTLTSYLGIYSLYNVLFFLPFPVFDPFPLRYILSKDKAAILFLLAMEEVPFFALF